MQRSSPLRWRRTIRNSTQNSLSTVRGGSMSSPTSKHRARQNLRLHSSLQLESLGQGTGARRQFTLVANAPWLLEPLPHWCRTTFCRVVPTGLSFLTGSERVVSGILFRRDLRGLRLAFHGPGEGFLGGAIVEVLDLLILLCFPMDEHANGDEESSASLAGITPSATESATALATA